MSYLYKAVPDSEAKPMKPERLARMRADCKVPGGAFTRSEVAELLAHIDLQTKQLQQFEEKTNTLATELRKAEADDREWKAQTLCATPSEARVRIVSLEAAQDRLSKEHSKAMAEARAVQAAIRKVVVERRGDAGGGMDIVTDIDRAFGQADYWKVEALKYRDRCLVTEADVREAGVTWKHVQAWAKVSPYARTESHSYSDPYWMKQDAEENEGRQMMRLILSTISLGSSASQLGDNPKCPHDILDEMAAMEVQP